MTSLGADDLHLTDKLVIELNDFLAARDETELATVLEAVPSPVRMAVNQFLKERCAPQPGAFNLYGPLDVVREAYFGGVDDEFEEYVSGAYMIGLGIRVTNERREDGDVGWAIQLRSDEVMLPASAEKRAWALPDGVELVRTWTGDEAKRDVVREALGVADTAARNGQWVRAHTVFQSSSEDLEGSGSSDFVVDVFDAPIPLDEDDENPEAFSAQFA